MVKYYGRAKERTGSVNTNQIGLNMSGCVSRVGRTGPLAKNVSMRSKCNVKFCGEVYYQGQLWATNDGPCVEKAQQRSLELLRKKGKMSHKIQTMIR
jgi:hypothetical protein